MAFQDLILKLKAAMRKLLPDLFEEQSDLLHKLGLHAINLGDSGFMVVRDGCTVFRSPVQQHDFNYPYQLGSDNGGDLPSSGQLRTSEMGGHVTEFADSKLNGEYSVEALGLVFNLALSCTAPKQQRPSMEQVVAALEKALQISKK